MQNESDLLDTDLLPIRTAEGIPPAVCEAAPTGSVVYSWQRNRKPLYSLQKEPRSMLGSLGLTTLTSICIF